jgi:hypothetical protein
LSGKSTRRWAHAMSRFAAKWPSHPHRNLSRDALIARSRTRWRTMNWRCKTTAVFCAPKSAASALRFPPRWPGTFRSAGRPVGGAGQVSRARSGHLSTDRLGLHLCRDRNGRVRAHKLHRIRSGASHSSTSTPKQPARRHGRKGRGRFKVEGLRFRRMSRRQERGCRSAEQRRDALSSHGRATTSPKTLDATGPAVSSASSVSPRGTTIFEARRRCGPWSREAQARLSVLNRAIPSSRPDACCFKLSAAAADSSTRAAFCCVPRSMDATA